MSKSWGRDRAHERIQEKTRRGECQSCTAKARPGKTLCSRCARRAALYQKAYREREAGGYDPEITDKDRALMAHGRCERCKLLKPCVRLPTIEELAISRVDGGDGAIVTSRSKSGAVTR